MYSVTKMQKYHVSIAAEAIAAAQFARLGCNVAVQYGANQPGYDLMVSRGTVIRKISIKGTQIEAGWNLTKRPLGATYSVSEESELWRAKIRDIIFCFE